MIRVNFETRRMFLDAMFYLDEINRLRTPLVTVIRRVCEKSDAPVKQHFSIEQNLGEDEEDTNAQAVYFAGSGFSRRPFSESARRIRRDGSKSTRIRRQIHE